MKEKLHIKHIEIWIIVLIITLGGGIAAIVYGILNIGTGDYQPGFYEISAKINEDIPHYDDNYNLLYYLDGESKAIVNKQKELEEVYSSALATSYYLFDEEEEHGTLSSIGYINKHINEELTIDSRLYAKLLDAYDRSSNSVNYSIFASSLYGFWNELILYTTYEEQVLADPLNNVENKECLNMFASLIKDKNNIDLEFLGNNTVKLKVNSDYIKKLTEEEMNYPYISLNVLKSSYIVDYVVEELQEKGYMKPIMLSHDGVIREGIGVASGDYPVYEPSNDTIKQVLTVKQKTPLSFSSFYQFDVYEQTKPPYYQIEKDGVNYLRSLFIDINLGYSNNTYLVTGVIKQNASSVEVSYLNNELQSLRNIDEIKDYLNAHNMENEMILVDFHKNDKTIYVSEALYNFVSISLELDYNLINFQEVNA